MNTQVAARAAQPGSDASETAFPHIESTLYIGGQWRVAARTMPIPDAWSGRTLVEAGCADGADVDAALASAARGRRAMAALGSAQRATILRGTAARVREQAERFARLIVAEVGKPLTQARREVARCVNTLELAAEESTRLLGETIAFDSFPGALRRSGHYVFEPLGVVVAITPFNDPLNLVAHKLGPAIAGGNAVILKPAEQAPLSAVLLVRELLAAGLPAEGVNVLTGHGAEFGDRLVADPAVALVSFTGGEAAAARIAAAAGIKRLSMELGANSPVIVSAKADLARAVEACVAGAFSAAGQNCVGVQRIYVQQGVYPAFRDAFVARAGRLRIGDPANADCDVGPLISLAHARRVQDIVDASVGLGARIALGGVRSGTLFAPTVLEDVPHAAPALSREIFGPVVSLLPYATLDEAILAANGADFRIHAAIFTDDLQEAMQATRELSAAGVMVNDSTDYRLDAMPFGGAGRGSMGREGVRFALREMVQTKVLCFAG